MFDYRLFHSAGQDAEHQTVPKAYGTLKTPLYGISHKYIVLIFSLSNAGELPEGTMRRPAGKAEGEWDPLIDDPH